MKVIAVANQKGGVAKTTTAQNLASGLAMLNRRVLIIDTDSQANLTDVFGVVNPQFTLYHLLKKTCNIDDVLLNLKENLDIIPSDILVAGLETELNDSGREYRLREELENISHLYDYCIIDTPPSLGVLTKNAFTSADYIIIPSEAAAFSINGIVQLFNTITSVRKYNNPKLAVAGILLTRFNPRTNLASSMSKLTNDLAGLIDVHIFDVAINQNVAIEESQALKKDIFSHNSKSSGASDYLSFISKLVDITEKVQGE